MQDLVSRVSACSSSSYEVNQNELDGSRYSLHACDMCWHGLLPKNGQNMSKYKPLLSWELTLIRLHFRGK